MELYFDLQTHKIEYYLKEKENKPKILFLHGCGGNLQQFEHEYLNLIDNYSVASISLRDHGKSTRPSSNKFEDVSMQELAHDVIKWIKAHKWQKCHVVACSMGGVVALEIVCQQQNIFSSITTFGTSPKISLPLTLMKPALWLVDVFLPERFPNWMAKTISKATTDKKDAQLRFSEDLKIAYTRCRTIYQLRCHLSNYDYIQLLRDINIPVYLLQGEKDKDINKEIEKAWSIIGQNELIKKEVILNAGHITNYDQPQEFLNRIRMFNEEHKK